MAIKQLYNMPFDDVQNGVPCYIVNPMGVNPMFSIYGIAHTGVTTPYNASSNQHVEAEQNGGIVQLPAGIIEGTSCVEVSCRVAGITVLPPGATTINGAANYPMVLNECVMFYWNGAMWAIRG